MIPTLSWWLVLQACGLAALPLAWRFFARLPGRGYPFAKALGLLLAAYILWMGAMLRVLPNDLGGSLFALILAATLSWWLGRAGWRRSADGTRPLLEWMRAHRALVVATEALFLLAFVAWAVVRAYNPEISSTEKPMEFAFLNGVLRSSFFPPRDPWLSGYAISYYYFGYVMVGLLVRLSGVLPEIGFNLAVASWFAMTLLGAFGVVYDLVLMHKGDEASAGRGIRFGFIGALFAGVIGNLEGILELFYHRRWMSPQVAAWLDIHGLNTAPPTGNWTGGFWWWWRASRVVHDKDLTGAYKDVINEFPLFSFLLGDLHPHVLALPFVLLAVALALQLLLSAIETGDVVEEPAVSPAQLPRPLATLAPLAGWLQRLTGLGWAGVLLSALVLGALAFLNTWDFPIYLALSAAAIAGGLALGGRLDRAGWGRTVAAAATLGLLGVLLYLPFYIGFQSQAGGVLPNLLFPTRLTHYLIVFGPLLVPMLLFLLLLASDLPRRELLSRISSGAMWAFSLPLLLVLAVFIALMLLPSTRQTIQELLASPAFRGSVGAGTPGNLLGVALGVRAATPWTVLFVALALGLVYALLRGAAANPRRSPADLIVVVMAAIALLLTYAVEFFYLRDNFGTRMNTVFKFYYQAWILMALAAAYGLSRLTSRAAPRSYRIAALVVTEVLVVAALYYPAAAIPSKTDNFAARAALPGLSALPTLDGLAYLRATNPDDAAAIDWIRGNVPDNATVLEAIGAPYNPGDSRISMATGNATLLGWDGHEAQWRGKAYGELAGGRPEAIDRIYRAPQPDTVIGFMQQWKLDYLLIGEAERRKYGVTDMQLERLDRAMQLVFESGGTRIYAR